MRTLATRAVPFARLSRIFEHAPRGRRPLVLYVTMRRHDSQTAQESRRSEQDRTRLDRRSRTSSMQKTNVLDKRGARAVLTMNRDGETGAGRRFEEERECNEPDIPANGADDTDVEHAAGRQEHVLRLPTGSCSPNSLRLAGNPADALPSAGIDRWHTTCSSRISRSRKEHIVWLIRSSVVSSAPP